MPASARSASSSSSTAAALALSRLPVGSSDNSSSGRLARLRAIATRWRSPPDSANGRWPKRPPSPTCSSSSAARFRRSGAGKAGAAHRDLDILDGRERRQQQELLEDDADLAAPERRPCPPVATSAPCHNTRPPVGRSKPAMMWTRLLLPLPLGPTIETNSPRAIDMSMPRKRHDRAVVEDPADIVERNQRRVSGSSCSP